MPRPERYLSVTQVAELLGVSRQRVQQYARDDPEFPAPAVLVGNSDRGWRQQDIERYRRVRAARRGGPDRH